jgi:alpha-tubulin suppressor-like RCC1 family protein
MWHGHLVTKKNFYQIMLSSYLLIFVMSANAFISTAFWKKRGVASFGTPTMIAGGMAHYCAIANQAAYCWGNNSSGQLGNSTTTSSSTPVLVTGLTSGVTGIFAGANTSCAIVNGAAYCWGSNAIGQLGNGTTVNSSIPLLVTGLSSGVTSISTNGSTGSSCAVVNGAAKCWGAYNSYGTMGNGTQTSSPTPTLVPGLSSGVTAITTGQNAPVSCAIVNGAAKCWGFLGPGIGMGDGSNSQTATLSPVQVYGMTTNVTSVVCGDAHCCAAKAGVISCWGANLNLQLGSIYGNSSTIATSPTVAQYAGNGTSLTANSNTSCGFVLNGAAYCWGYNYYSQVATGTNVTSMAVGGYSTCKIDGNIAYCQGYNSAGELGNASTPIGSTAAATPVSGLP